MCSRHVWTAEQSTSARKDKAEPGKGCGEDMLNSSLFLQLYRKFQLLAVCLGKPHLVTPSEQREQKERRCTKTRCLSTHFALAVGLRFLLYLYTEE